MINRYFIALFISLMAPAMVLPMGLDQDPDLKADREVKEKQAVAQGNVPSLLDLCKQEVLKNGFPGATEQEKEKNAAAIFTLSRTRAELRPLFVPKRLLSCEKLIKNEITPEQYKFLQLLVFHDRYAHYEAGKSMGRFTYRFHAFSSPDYGNCYPSWDFSLWLRMHYSDLRAKISKQSYRVRDEDAFHTFYYALYPLDLSILARKHNVPVKELRKTLDSFDPEVREHIIKTYNIKTDWFYWLTRPAVLKSAAGVAVAGLTTYLGWKLFRK